MPPHSLCASSSEPRQNSYIVPSTPSSPSIHRPSLVQDMKKIRNSKQLSLKVSPPSLGDVTDTCSSSSNLSMNIITPSPSFPPSSTSLSSRRPFTPSPLSSASLHTPTRSSASTSKRHSQLLLDDALPTPRLPLPTTASHRSISAYFSDFSLECGAASPYTTEPVCVLPNLYLGAEHNATDVRTLQRLGITFVLNVAIEIAKEDAGLEVSSMRVEEAGSIRGGVHFKSLAWTHHQKDLLRDFPTAFAMIDEAVARNHGNGKALIHCQLGVSRSASLVIAYVMKTLGMGLTEAYDFVKQRSAVISPNMSLMYQLAEYGKSLKNPGGVITVPAASSMDSASVRNRGSWSSQLDDDEPPYPFSAAFSAAASAPPPTVAPIASRASIMDDYMTPSTPTRQDFCKRPLTPEDELEDLPNTKPFQSPSRLTHPKSSFLASRRSHLGLNQGTSRSAPRSPLDLSRSGYQRSPLTSSSVISGSQTATPTQASYPLKTPTAENFPSFNLEVPSSSCDVEMMVPPTPLFQSSFTIPSLSSSSSSSSASSVSSFEACTRPSISSTTSSSSTYFTACDDEEVLGGDTDVSSPRNSGTWSRLPLMCMSSVSEVVVVVNHEEHQAQHTEQELSQQQRLKQPEPKNKKKANALWSGLKALQVVTEVSAVASSTARAIVTATAASSSVATTTTVVESIAATTAIATPSSSSHPKVTTNAALSKAKGSKLPDFIFSPRPYTPTHHETRSFKDFYKALCMGG
ncbi:hypothetical protein BGZ58_000009 [Dissophora ornata]|nr:hypothetical protein BGZ58_000009 [Dissophora ornata]